MAKNIIKALSLSEISAVDYPAQEHATMTIMKRDDWEPYWKRDFSQEERDMMAEHGQAMEDGSFPIKTVADLKNAIHAIGRAKNPEAVKRHIIARARALGATDLLPDNWNVSKQKKPSDMSMMDNEEEDAAECGDQMSGRRRKPMSDETKKVADLEKQVTDLTKRATDAEAKVAELAKAKADADAKLAEVTKAKEAAEKDEVIKVGETEVKKSAVGDATFAVIKAQQAEIAKERDAREIVELTKRAETELPSLPGDPVAKGKVLRAVAKMNEEDGKALTTMLKAGEEAMKSRMREIGQVGGGTDSGSPLAKMDALAKAKAEKDNISVAKAHDVLSQGDAVYKSLYDEAYGRKKAA